MVFRSLWDVKHFRGLKTPQNTREVRGSSNLLKIRDVPLCLIFGTKEYKHQGTPGVFGSVVIHAMVVVFIDLCLRIGTLVKGGRPKKADFLFNCRLLQS